MEEYAYEREQREARKKKFYGFIEFGIFLLAAAAAAYIIINFVAQRTIVDGNSMNTTLNDGDSLIVEKVSYIFGDIHRFDIVVFPYYDDKRGEDVYYIKRVIGLPGEAIRITDGKIYINGEELKENYGYYVNDMPMEGYDAEEEYIIEENRYFVLGDNRNLSVDSRRIGCISGDDIVGKAVFRIFPLKDFGFIN